MNISSSFKKQQALYIIVTLLCYLSVPPHVTAQIGVPEIYDLPNKTTIITSESIKNLTQRDQILKIQQCGYLSEEDYINKKWTKSKPLEILLHPNEEQTIPVFYLYPSEFTGKSLTQYEFEVYMEDPDQSLLRPRRMGFFKLVIPVEKITPLTRRVIIQRDLEQIQVYPTPNCKNGITIRQNR